MIRGIFAKFKAALRSRGLFAAIQNPIPVLIYVLTHPFGHGPRNRIQKAIGEKFDREHGVETEDKIRPSELNAAGRNVEFASPYQPILPQAILEVLPQLPVDFERSVFVDFGSGKGRAVFLASEFPFKKIVGIEFSPLLHQVAVENCRKYHGQKQKCKAIELLCMDAVEYEIPPDPVILFLYNPFDKQVMEQVAAKLNHSLRQTPRKVFVIYFFPQVHGVWERVESLVPYPIRQPQWPFRRPLFVKKFFEVWASHLRSVDGSEPRIDAGS